MPAQAARVLVDDEAAVYRECCEAAASKVSTKCPWCGGVLEVYDKPGTQFRVYYRCTGQPSAAAAASGDATSGAGAGGGADDGSAVTGITAAAAGCAYTEHFVFPAAFMRPRPCAAAGEPHHLCRSDAADSKAQCRHCRYSED